MENGIREQFTHLLWLIEKPALKMLKKQLQKTHKTTNYMLYDVTTHRRKCSRCGADDFKGGSNISSLYHSTKYSCNFNMLLILNTFNQKKSQTKEVLCTSFALQSPHLWCMFLCSVRQSKPNLLSRCKSLKWKKGDLSTIFGAKNSGSSSKCILPYIIWVCLEAIESERIASNSIGNKSNAISVVPIFMLLSIFSSRNFSALFPLFWSLTMCDALILALQGNTRSKDDDERRKRVRQNLF